MNERRSLYGPLLLVSAVISFAEPVDVLTNRYDVMRSGSNLEETSLTPRTVSPRTFGKLFERKVDGDIYAQPLVKTGVLIPGSGMRNVVYVATVKNSLYAFDADSPAAQKPFWCHSREVFGDPVPKDDVTDMPKDEKYLNFASTVGIVATPVIDAQTKTIYVVANSKKGNEYSFHMHAFDIATGRERTGDEQPDGGQGGGSGVGMEYGRMSDGRSNSTQENVQTVQGCCSSAVFCVSPSPLTWTVSRFSSCHGWILAYDAKPLETRSVLCTTPGRHSRRNLAEPGPACRRMNGKELVRCCMQ